MTRWCESDTLAEDFQQQRDRLVRVARRMLGSSADAEDAVQEAWLRLARQDAGTIDNLAAWLTRVVTRICLDVLRARKVRLESPFEGHLPEAVTTEDDDGVPEDEMLLAESVGLGLLKVIDSLSPPERLAFVLHDLFAVPFQEVGEILDKSTDATKMLGSRARRKLDRTRPPSGGGRLRHDVVDAFRAAARCGDFADLMHVLDPDSMRRRPWTRGFGPVTSGAPEVERAVERRQAG